MSEEIQGKMIVTFDDAIRSARRNADAYDELQAKYEELKKQKEDDELFIMYLVAELDDIRNPNCIDLAVQFRREQLLKEQQDG
jgi:hypothetical protein